MPGGQEGGAGGTGGRGGPGGPGGGTGGTGGVGGSGGAGGRPRRRASDRGLGFERRIIAFLLGIMILLAGAFIWERQIREAEDQASRADRKELRDRSRTVECFIVGVIDPAVARARASGEPLPDNALRALEKIRNPATVEDAATAECEPFLIGQGKPEEGP